MLTRSTSGCVLALIGQSSKYIALCGLPYKYLTDIIHGHCLGILGKDLASVHHSGQYWKVIKLASKLAQRLW